MYIPIFKNRKHEKNTIAQYSNDFSDEIIPLVEIFKREMYVEYKKDNMGKTVFEIVSGQYTTIGNPRKRKVKDYETDVTIQRILSVLNGRRAFIDFFRFAPDFYGDNLSESMNWSAELSRNWSAYADCFDEILSIESLIPVITLKSNTHIIENEVQKLFDRLTIIRQTIALRVTMDYYYLHKGFIDKLIQRLRSSDYLFLDINENKIFAYQEDIEAVFNNKNTKSKRIILHSPRERSRYNKDYDEGVHRAGIDNSLIYEYNQYSADGVGDYVGVADNVEGTRLGKHAATLLYNLKDKCFYSFRVKNSDFKKLKSLILNWDKINEPQYMECKGKIAVNNLNYGWFGDWKEVSMLCYMNAVLLHLSSAN